MADKPNGDGSDNPNGDKGDAAKFVTEEQLNKAITGHLARFEKRLPELFGKQSEDLLAKLTEKLAKKPDTDDEGDGDDAAGGTAAGKDGDQIAKLKRKHDRELAEMRKRLDKTETERNTERTQARDTRLRTLVDELLAASGIDGARIKQARGFLVDAEKRAYLRDGDDRPMFRDGDDVEVELKEGIAAWAKSDDAKIYLPPRGAGGSGDRGGGKNPPSGNKAADRKQAAAVAIVRALNS